MGLNRMKSEITAQEHEAHHLVQVYSQLPIEPTGADGVYLHCGNRKIIDFYGGHAVTALGYGHPDMLDALNAQANSIFFQSNAVAMEVRARAAETLASFAPGGLEQVFFVNSGSEANENALRIACKLSGRSRITAIEHSFHGRTAAAGMVTWGARQSWYGFPGAPFNVDFIPRDDLDHVDEKITDETAAVILELVQGVGGAYSLNPDFVKAIADACAKRGALLIVDEVQTGIGRCGKPFATNIYNVKPDILTSCQIDRRWLPLRRRDRLKRGHRPVAGPRRSRQHLRWRSTRVRTDRYGDQGHQARRPHGERADSFADAG